MRRYSGGSPVNGEKRAMKAARVSSAPGIEYTRFTWYHKAFAERLAGNGGSAGLEDLQVVVARKGYWS